MMQHLIVFPVVLPLVAGILLLYQRQGLVRYKRAVSVAATVLLLLVAIGLLHLLCPGRLASTVRHCASTGSPLGTDAAGHCCFGGRRRCVCLRGG